MSITQGGDKIDLHFTWKPNWEGFKALPGFENAMDTYQGALKQFIQINEFKELMKMI